jgi:uncharacterized protein
MARPLILFAPGAGAPSTSAWMERWAGHLAALGDVVRLDYPYVEAGRRAPDRLPVLVAAHRAALEAARARHGGPVVLAGKSMGGRVGCHLALEVHVAALVCLGYPLVGQRGPSRGEAPTGFAGRGGGGEPPRNVVRDEVLRALDTPILFVQGTRDRLCPLDRLATVRAAMGAPSDLHVVEGGDHSLLVGARSLAGAGEAQADVEARAVTAIRVFLAARVG